MALASAAVAIADGPPILRTKRLRVRLLRAGLSAGSWWMYSASFQALDLAHATTLSFSSQVFLVILAPLCLSVRLTARRLGVTILGLGGIATAVRLWGVQSIDRLALYGLISALLGAVVLVIMRSLSRIKRTQTILFGIGVTVFLTALPPRSIGLDALAGRGVVTIAAMRLPGTGAVWLVGEAYRYAGASALASSPFCASTFLAWAEIIFFVETMLPESFAGADLIAASAIVIISESKKKAHDPGRDRARLASQWQRGTSSEQR
ncbi:DMT family transporter [Microvirga makkahensis]|uniref:EamA domain-containing protein n=1 Tax=Microvirga makkahensis TaxID=1128670 RepID=A0A7X3SP80_9HYPH|nr:DMT family transporter [Microvirga makkahensis]MXQ12171.1 hypothetical protein [Microvirga makkahensis]